MNAASVNSASARMERLRMTRRASVWSRIAAIRRCSDSVGRGISIRSKSDFLSDGTEWSRLQWWLVGGNCVLEKWKMVCIGRIKSSKTQRDD